MLPASLAGLGLLLMVVTHLGASLLQKLDEIHAALRKKPTDDEFVRKRKLAIHPRKEWCAREDLNLHPFRDQILSLACLPFHHARSKEKHIPIPAVGASGSARNQGSPDGVTTRASGRNRRRKSAAHCAEELRAVEAPREWNTTTERFDYRPAAIRTSAKRKNNTRSSPERGSETVQK